ncbi:MAG TPA: nucleotidyltransferase substrate binding protein [Chthoniobacterales bacterium]|jgi:nucleotidyltransferase substrate binding protein (TIGR01987 family)
MARDADIRWRQRFESFKGAFAQLQRAVALARQRPLSELEQQGLIQAFEFTHELAWNVLKDFLREQGYVGIFGSKDATREAFRNGLVEDGDTWMEMIKARNLTTHTYDCDVAEAIAKDVLERFAPAFAAFEKKFDELARAK